MHYRKLGKSDIEASVVALGTWAIGGWMWGGTEEQEAVRAIETALDHGVNFLDTAPVYGFGRSEEVVGEVIAKRREDVVLATKCGLRWDLQEGDFHFSANDKGMDSDGDIKVYKYLAPASIREEVERSLKRLRTDYIDLYQTHWQETTTPIEDTMAELLKLKHQGKIRAIGCSNATPGQMQEYLANGQLDCDQERYSMLDRDHESDDLPFCAEHDIAFLAYSPLALGLLTGKIGPEREFGEGDLRQTKPRFSVDNRRKVRHMLDRFEPIAKEHDCTLAQLVIAWTVHQPGCTHALVGARTVQQATENAAAGDIELTQDELTRMRAAIDEFAADIP